MVRKREVVRGRKRKKNREEEKEIVRGRRKKAIGARFDLRRIKQDSKTKRWKCDSRSLLSSDCL